MENTTETNEVKGFHKPSQLQRIGFGSGDLAQSLTYQVVCMYLLIFYINAYGLKPEVAIVMSLIVRIADVLRDPLVGAFVDKHNPKPGKYRSYLIWGGTPLTGFTILCFWNGLSGSLFYTYFTYVGLFMCYTLINVPYGALSVSLIRDTGEIMVLAPVCMFPANLGGLAAAYGTPILVKVLSPDGKINTTASANAWPIMMTIYAVIGLMSLMFCFNQTKERVVTDQEETSKIRVSGLWVEFCRNRSLRILMSFLITAFVAMTIGNPAGPCYMIYNVRVPEMSPYSMTLGSIPVFIFMSVVPAIKHATGEKRMFYASLSVAILGMALLYTISMVPVLKTQIWLVFVAQFIESTGVTIATGYMWALVPEVIPYGGCTHGKRIPGIANALTGVFYKAGMTLGGAVPGLVMVFAESDQTNEVSQSSFAEQGILWPVAVILALLLLVTMFIISKHELEDNVIDDINGEVESRCKKGEQVRQQNAYYPKT